MELKLANIPRLILAFGMVWKSNSLLGLANDNQPVSRTITIGFLDELTLKDGKTPSWGVFTLNGFKLGLSEGLNKSKVKFNIIEKNVSRSPIAAKIAAAELLDGNVDVIVGLREDGQALMVKSVTEGKVPFITSMATSDRLLSKDSWTLSMALRNSKQTEALIEYLIPRIGKEREIATIVTRNCTYCVDMNRLLAEKLALYGVKVKMISSIMHGTPIPSDIFKDYNLEHAFIGLYTDEIEGLSLLKILKSKGYQGTAFGGDSWPVTYLGQGFNINDYASMCLVNSLSFDSSTSKAKEDFYQKYMNTFGEPANDMAGLAFDTGLILAKALISCTNKRLNSKDFASCIPSTIKGQTLSGATGNFRIADDGGRQTSTNLLKKFAKCQEK